MIPLEDNFNDILGKAQRGLKLDDAQLAKASGVSPAELARASEGHFDEGIVRRLAPTLKLHADALVALGRKSWQPGNPGDVTGLASFNTPYGDITVNAYLAHDGDAAVVFDTGADASDVLKYAEGQGIKIELILLTHTHPDHIADLARLRLATGAKALVGDREGFADAESFPAGREFRAGVLRIETRLTWGHARGGITYVVHGLPRKIAVVGDAMFAGSMGGGTVSYADALRTNRENILSLPDDTILCPGHGPLTTVGEEKQHNPFFA